MKDIIKALATCIYIATWPPQTLAADKPAKNPQTTQRQTQTETKSTWTQSERSRQIANDRIEQETTQGGRFAPVAEAVTAVEETRKAVIFLDQKNTAEAKAALERALGRTEIVLGAHPDVALVPVSVTVAVIDTEVDDATIKRFTSEVKDLVDDNRFQAARLLLRDLASEIDITTANLPIATYPDAIRSAARLIEQNKIVEAKSQLLTALHSLAIVETIVPLPILRAQALIDEATQLASDPKANKDEAMRLLDDADRQLSYAEKIGYGSKKQEFADVQKSIKEAKQQIEKGQDSKGLLAKLKGSLQKMKERFSSRSSSSDKQKTM